MTDSPSTLGPGSTVKNGEVKLLSRLGRGGFGEVFLAQTAAGLKAVKVVDTAIWSENEYQVFNAMLMAEASFLSTLDHPALPKSGGFFAEASRYFLVMDWVKGHTLEEFVSRHGPLNLEEVFSLLGAVIDVLVYLHRECEGVVVFGDLKPANILRTQEGNYRLVDLGLVSKQGSKMSKSIAVFSPNFAAPERTRGGASHPSQDIFSLGATVFFALTGKEPQPNLSSKELERVLTKSLAGDDEGWGGASRHCLEQLLTLVLAALDLEPDGRPKSILSFRQAWERTAEVRKEEVEAREVGGVDEIVRLLYKKNEQGR
jgi:serine/threonine protein kinase